MQSFVGRKLGSQLFSPLYNKFKFNICNNNNYINYVNKRWYSVADHKEYLRRYGEVNSLEEFFKLKKEVLDEENKYREAFAKNDKDIIDKLSKNNTNDKTQMMIPVFEHAQHFKQRDINDGLPKVFPIKNPPAPGNPVIVASQEEFSKNFTIFTESQFKGFNWDNVFVAGGSVLAALAPMPDRYATNNAMKRLFYHDIAYKSSDIDLFIYGLNEEQANKKLQEIYSYISDNLYVETVAFRSQHAVSIVSQYPNRHIQIVLRLYQSPAEILMGFDVDACAMGYDGTNVWMLPRCHQALVTSTNTIDMKRRSPTYEQRLAKYAKRGFSVTVPTLERNRIDPLIYDANFNEIHGLAKLLLLERLTTPEARLQYKNQQRLKGLLPTYEKRGSYWNDLHTRLSDEYSTDREEDGDGYSSDYSSVFLPWGPKWTAYRAKKIMFKKDLILNSRWYNNNKTYHTHPCFFGTVHEIMQDCCGTCPPQPAEDATVDPVTGLTKDIWVRGPLTWIEVNPGQQSIGSFHPITEGDWSSGAYIDPKTEKLCAAVNANDIDAVNLALEDGANVNSVDTLGRTALIVATICNHVECVKLLLEKGAWISYKTKSLKNPFHYAAQYGHLEILKLLLQRGKELDELNTPAQEAKGNSETKVQEEKEEEEEEEEEEEGGEEEKEVQEVSDIAKKAEVDYNLFDVVDGDDMTPLQYATFFGWTECVELLLSHGANMKNMIEAKSKHRDTTVSLLYLSTLNNKWDIFKLLLSKGASINQRDKYFRTVLHHLVIDQKEDFVEYILTNIKDVAVSALDNNNNSALHYAVALGNLKIAKLLIDHGAIINYSKEDFKTNTLSPDADFKLFYPIIFSSYNIENPTDEMIKLLIAGGADLTAEAPRSRWSDRDKKYDLLDYVLSQQYRTEWKVPFSDQKNWFYTPKEIDEAIANVDQNLQYMKYRLKTKFSSVYNEPEKQEKEWNEENKREVEKVEKENNTLKLSLQFIETLYATGKFGAKKEREIKNSKGPIAKQPPQIDTKIQLLLDPISFQAQKTNVKSLVDQSKAWQLYEAAFTGDITQIEKLTKDNDIYVSMIEVETGNTPLHVAMINNKYEAALKLIDIARRQHVPVKIKEDDNPVLRINNFNLASRFVSYDDYDGEDNWEYEATKRVFQIDPNSIDNTIHTYTVSELVQQRNVEDHSLVHIAARHGYVDGLIALLNRMDKIKNIPLSDVYYKSEVTRPAVVSALLAHSFSNNYSPFELAIINGQVDAARELLKRGGWFPKIMTSKQISTTADEEYKGLKGGESFEEGEKTRSKNRVTFLASYFNQPASLKFLLEENSYELFLDGQIEVAKKEYERAKRRKQTKDDFDSEAQLEKLKELFPGWKIDDKDRRGRSMLYAAVAGNAPDSVQYLVKYMKENNKQNLIDVGTKEESGVTPLFLAAYLGHQECIKALLDNGADFTKVDSVHGWTPLHASVSVNKIETVKLLVEKTQEAQRLDIINHPGRAHQQTPLLLATMLNEEPIVKLLLEFGANPTMMDVGGDNALHIITNHLSIECLSVITEALERANATDLAVAENYIGLTPEDYAKIKYLKANLEAITLFDHYRGGTVKRKKELKEKTLYDKLIEYVQKHKPKRVIADATKVRESVEITLALTNRLREIETAARTEYYADYNNRESYYGHSKYMYGEDAHKIFPHKIKVSKISFPKPNYTKFINGIGETNLKSED